jgi:hypothetical protein
MATPPVFTAGQVLTAAQMNAVGLWKITQNSFTAASTVNVDDCFTSDFVNYRLLFRFVSTSGTTTLGFRLRAGGTNAITNYDRSILTINDTTVTGVRLSAQTSWVIESADTGRNTFCAMDIAAPQIATNTSYVSLNVRETTIQSNFRTGMHSDATSYDGFGLIITGGVSVTGSVFVYGYR